MTHLQIVCKLRAPQIIITIHHSQIFVVHFRIDRERQIVRAIQNVQLAWNDFDVPRGEPRIFRAWHARRDSATDLNHIFATQCVRLLRNFCVFLGAKNNLR